MAGRASSCCLIPWACCCRASNWLLWLRRQIALRPHDLLAHQQALLLLLQAGALLLQRQQPRAELLLLVLLLAEQLLNLLQLLLIGLPLQLQSLQLLHSGLQLLLALLQRLVLGLQQLDLIAQLALVQQGGPLLLVDGRQAKPDLAQLLHRCLKFGQPLLPQAQGGAGLAFPLLRLGQG